MIPTLSKYSSPFFHGFAPLFPHHFLSEGCSPWFHHDFPWRGVRAQHWLHFTSGWDDGRQPEPEWLAWTWQFCWENMKLKCSTDRFTVVYPNFFRYPHVFSRFSRKRMAHLWPWVAHGSSHARHCGQGHQGSNSAVGKWRLEWRLQQWIQSWSPGGIWRDLEGCKMPKPKKVI